MLSSDLFQIDADPVDWLDPGGWTPVCTMYMYIQVCH